MRFCLLSHFFHHCLSFMPASWAGSLFFIWFVEWSIMGWPSDNQYSWWVEKILSPNASWLNIFLDGTILTTQSNHNSTMTSHQWTLLNQEISSLFGGSFGNSYSKSKPYPLQQNKHISNLNSNPNSYQNPQNIQKYLNLLPCHEKVKKTLHFSRFMLLFWHSFHPFSLSFVGWYCFTYKVEMAA